MADEGKGGKDVVKEARSFCDNLENVFMRRKRDPQTQRLMEKAKGLLEELMVQNQKLQTTGGSTTPRTQARGGMGQLWVKLDELKRENDDLRRLLGRGDERLSGTPQGSPTRNTGSHPSPRSPGAHDSRLTQSHPSPKSAALNDTTTADLNKAKSENETLKAENTKMQKSIRDMESMNTGLQDVCKRHKAALDAGHKTMDELRTKNAELERKVSNLNELQMKNTEMESNLSNLDELRKKNAELESNLSKLKTEHETLRQQKPPTAAKPVGIINHMRHQGSPTHRPNENHVQASPPSHRPIDHRKVENINEKCRPSVIGMRYNTLESQEWMEAKETLEESTEENEEVIVKFLCALLMNTHESCKHTHRNMLCGISELLRQPTLQNLECVNGSSDHSIPDEMRDAMNAMLRQTWEDVDILPIIQRAVDVTCHQYPEFLNLWQAGTKSVDHYLQECAKLCWQMTIQVPPMILSTSDNIYDESYHKLWWSCDQAGARTIEHFVWPALYDYEDGNLLIKGCVSTNS